MSSFNIALRNSSGIPVVDLIGSIDKDTVATVEDILKRLVQAGHYNAMLNLKRATWMRPDLLSPLNTIGAQFRAHYGELDVIASIEQIQSLSKKLGDKASNILSFYTSENQALGRIKRLPPQLLGEIKSTTAKLVETI